MKPTCTFLKFYLHLEFLGEMEMSFIWKTTKDSDFKQILNPWVLRLSPLEPPNFGLHLEIWRKKKLLFISKTVRDTAILGRF